MSTADRVVVVSIQEFQQDQRPQPLQNGLIHHYPKINFLKKQYYLRLRRNLFPINLKCPNVRRKTNISDTDFWWWKPPSLPACTHGWHDIKKIRQGATRQVGIADVRCSRRSCLSIYKTKQKIFKIPDIFHRPTAAAVAGGNCRQMALQILIKKGDTTLQQSVLCHLSLLYLS